MIEGGINLVSFQQGFMRVSWILDVSRGFPEGFKSGFKENSRKCSRSFKEVSCCMALIAATRAERGLV